MRLTVTITALILSLTLVACGSSSKETSPSSDNPPTQLSPTQAEALKARAEKFALSMNAVAVGAEECSNGAKSSEAITSCLAVILVKADKQMDDIILYANSLAKSVSGQCQVQLQAFSGAMAAASDGFAKSAEDAKANDLKALNRDLAAVNAKAISATGKKVDQACQGVVSDS